MENKEMESADNELAAIKICLILCLKSLEENPSKEPRWLAINEATKGILALVDDPLLTASEKMPIIYRQIIHMGVTASTPLPPENWQEGGMIGHQWLDAVHGKDQSQPPWIISAKIWIHVLFLSTIPYVMSI